MYQSQFQWQVLQPNPTGIVHILEVPLPGRVHLWILCQPGGTALQLDRACTKYRLLPVGAAV